MTPLSIRVLTAVAALAGLAACMEPTPRAEACRTPEACQIAQLMVAEMQSDVGRDFGGGVVMRGISAAGSLVVFDLGLPIPAAGLEEVQKRALHSVAADGFAEGFCDDPDANDVFQFGNAYQVRSFGNDGALIGASTLRSCGA